MTNVVNQLNLFYDYLDSCKKSINISITDSRIVSTLRWLIDVQEDDGSWDHRSVASTSVSIIAIETLRTPTAGWGLNESIDKALKSAIHFLSESYNENQWEEDVWDTAFAVRALCIAKIPDSHSIAEKPLKWLRSLSFSGNLSPHHIAQVALAFSEAGSDRAILESTLDTLEKSFEESRLSYSPYVLAQVAEALCLRNDRSEILSKISNILVRSLKNAALDNANFLNICLSLQGLHSINPRFGLKIFRISSGSLFGPYCFRQNGSWYQSPWYTGWALITLTRYSNEVVIVAPYSELYYEYHEHVSKVKDELNNNDRKNNIFFLWSSLFLIFWGGLLSFFITYTTIETNMLEWIKWAIGFILGSSLIAYIPFVYKKVVSLLKGKL